jgi:RNA polymerase sigma-70 factor, ECF subfamily
MDRALIALGFDHFDRSMAGMTVSEFHVQAAIAATYARAIDSGVIDWAMILQCYDELQALNPSPVVALNRAVAVAKVHGASAALPIVDALENEQALHEYYLLLAVRGQLLLDLGRQTEAADAFRDALLCVSTEPERRFLSRKLTACAMAQ